MKNKLTDSVDLPDQVLDELMDCMNQYDIIYKAIWKYSEEEGINPKMIFNAMLNSFIHFILDRCNDENTIKAIEKITSRLVEESLNDMRTGKLNDNF
jgi:hypothetical protein